MCGIPSAITDDVNGFLIKPGNVEQLTNRLLALLENPKRISEIGSAARESVIQHYSEDMMVKQTLAVFEAVVTSDATNDNDAMVQDLW